MTTVSEVKTKETTLNTEIATQLEAIKVLTPATPEFDEAYTRYLTSKASLAKIPDEIAQALLAENADAIAVVATQTADAIVQLVTGLKVNDLIGCEVTALRMYTDSDNKKHVVFNPVTVIKASGKRSEKSQGRTVITDSEGNSQSLTKFVLAHATEDEKLTDAYKYPHVRVATKPKFDEFCESHNLTGFNYILPSSEGEAN